MTREEAILKALESVSHLTPEEEAEYEQTGREGVTPAPEGQVWVCGACGKTSPTKYGIDANDHHVAQPGWDESCMLNSVLCLTASIQRNEQGHIVYADAVPVCTSESNTEVPGGTK